MEREIKFRGLQIHNNECIEGSLELRDRVHANGKKGIDATISKSIYNEKYCNFIYIKERVILKTVGQFTGVKDINGVDVYEGDSIKMIKAWDCGDIVAYGFDGTVIFDDGAFFVDGLAQMDILELDKTSVYNFKFEVIGTIHDKK